MINFEFRRTSKKCSVSQRLLLPDEEFYSALVGDETNPQRLDFAIENWHGPPEDCVGWWKSKIPPAELGKIYPAPRSALLAFFEETRQHPATADVAYVTGLLLAQKKLFSIEDSEVGVASNCLTLKNRQTNETFEIQVVEIAPARLQEIQAVLSERLFSDQPFEQEEIADVPADEP